MRIAQLTVLITMLVLFVFDITITSSMLTYTTIAFLFVETLRGLVDETIRLWEGSRDA